MPRSLRTLVAALAVICAACGGPPRESHTVSRSVHLDGAQSAAVELTMGAGELAIAGGSQELVDARFRFNVPEWEPTVDYHVDGGRGTLTLKQPGSSVSFGRTENRWDLRLNDAVPLSLVAHVGAGEGHLTLGSLNLQGVEVNVGAGEMTIDLRGAPKRSYDVRVNGGVGTATVRVPKSVGIVATATGGIGEVSVDGLEKRDSQWVNAGHEQDPVMIHLDVKGGVGEIHVSAE